jgi:FkbM family methyltransferase
MLVDLHYTAGSKVVYANPPDWHEMHAWARVLRAGDCFVDVGANVGSYALWAAEHGAHVIAVEPDQRTAAALRRNVDLNPFPIAVHEVALADEPGRMCLTEGLDARNHLLVGQDDAGVQVRVTTLDELVNDCPRVFVKIDVEGSEELVVRGAKRALRDGRILMMQLEWNELSTTHFGRSRCTLAGLLSGYGYDFFRPDASGELIECAPDAGTSDVFAVLRSARPQLGLTEGERT